MLPIEDAEADREITKTSSRVMRFADNFWMGFREGRGEEGRYPIIPGTFARKKRDGELQSTPLGDLYVVARRRAGARWKRRSTRSRRNRRKLKTWCGEFDKCGSICSSSSPAADKKFVYWTERRGRGLFLRASPIDVPGLLEDKLFEEVRHGGVDFGNAFQRRQLFFHSRAAWA